MLSPSEAGEQRGGRGERLETQGRNGTGEKEEDDEQTGEGEKDKDEAWDDRKVSMDRSIFDILFFPLI